MPEKDQLDGKSQTTSEEIEALFKGIGDIPDVNTLCLISEKMDRAPEKNQLETLEVTMKGVTELHDKNEFKWQWHQEGVKKCREIALKVIDKTENNFYDGKIKDAGDIYRMILTLLKYKESSMYQEFSEGGTRVNGLLYILINEDRFYEEGSLFPIMCVINNTSSGDEILLDMVRILENIDKDEFRAFVQKLFTRPVISECAYSAIIPRLPDMKNFYEKNPIFAQKFGLKVLEQVGRGKSLDETQRSFLEKYIEKFDQYMELDPKGWGKVIKAFQDKKILQYQLNTYRFKKIYGRWR